MADADRRQHLVGTRLCVFAWPSGATVGAEGSVADGASGVVRSDTLVNSESPQCVSQVWEINEADIQLTDALYPVAQEAMRRGYYMPNRGSVHCSRHQCPHWRRCEQDFGGVVEA